MPSRREIPSVESHTTIVGVTFRNCAFVGADSRISVSPYGMVVSNTYEKMIRLCDGFYLLCSGSCYVTEELREVLPTCFTVRNPKTFEEMLDRVVAWVNFFAQYFRCIARMFIIGAFENNPFRIGKIDVDPNYEGYVHSGYLVEGSIITMGSGDVEALTAICDEGKKLLGKSTESMTSKAFKKFKKEGIKMIFKSLKEAARKDWNTGGKLHAVVLTKMDDTLYVQSPKNPFYIKSRYKQDPPLWRPFRISEEANEESEEANEESVEANEQSEESVETNEQSEESVEESVETNEQSEESVEGNEQKMKKRKEGPEPGTEAKKGRKLVSRSSSHT